MFRLRTIIMLWLARMLWRIVLSQWRRRRGRPYITAS